MAVIPHPGLVCLDKDGTLLDDVPYNVDPAAMRLAPGAADALRLLAEAGYRVAVVSNQAGVARGRFPESALGGVEARLGEMCAHAGVALQGFYYCPHDDGDGCGCRKPAAGLVERALRDADAPARTSWMVGDILDDIEAGRRAGCRTILLDIGNETEWRAGTEREPHWTVPDLASAARLIVARGARA